MGAIYLLTIVLKTFCKEMVFFTFYVKELLLFVEELYCHRFAYFLVPRIFECSCPQVSTKASVPGPPSARRSNPVYRMVKYLHITCICIWVAVECVYMLHHS